MLRESPSKESNVMMKLLQKASSEHKLIAKKWNQSMINGDICYGRPIGFNTRRLYLNAANKFWKYLKEDCSNLYEAAVKAIEACRPDQYSTRKHVKEAAISLAKYLKHKGVSNV
jgi:hypothetical protein